MNLNNIELVLREIVDWIKLFIEVIGIFIVLIGVVIAVFTFISHKSKLDPVNFHRIRLILGHYLVLALEFQLGADILSTAINPTWEQIGQLGAIAVIRTGLNYFLTKELSEETSKEQDAEHERNDQG